MTDIEILQHIRRVIAGAWTATYPAEDRSCSSVHEWSRRAVAWSACGAFMRLPERPIEAWERIRRMRQFDGDLEAFELRAGRTELQMRNAITAAIEELQHGSRSCATLSAKPSKTATGGRSDRNRRHLVRA